MSWRVVEAKWDGFREAFAGFDPATSRRSPTTTSSVSPPTRASSATGARSRRRSPTPRRCSPWTDEPGGFVGWLRSHDDFDATVAALRGEFRFLGDMGAYYFLYVVGENVPTHEEWMKTHPQKLNTGEVPCERQQARRLRSFARS